MNTGHTRPKRSKGGGGPKSLAAVLNRPIFEVDQMACLAAARAITNYRASADVRPWGETPRESRIAFKLAVIAICHQINWDFLNERLSAHLLCPDAAEMVSRLRRVTAFDLRQWLKGYSKPTRIQAPERAAMLRTVGEVLADRFGGDARALVRLSGNHMSGPTGFVAQLDAFEPYRGDPLRKKSYVLVQDLIREGTVVFEDEASLEPAIDYHVMRLYLRTGRVVPVFNVVSEALKGKPVHRPRLVQKLREAVAEALKLTASYAELTVAAVNYVEWQLGRTVCDVRRPGCVRTTRQDGLDPDIARLFEGNCPFQRFCNAKDDPEWRRLREPNLPTTFY